MIQFLGKVFKASNGSEYGILRETVAPLPDDLSGSHIFAEDECGNYFISKSDGIYFWDHETRKAEIIAVSIEEFIEGCVVPPAIRLEPGQVEKVWVDPEFSRKFGIKPKP